MGFTPLLTVFVLAIGSPFSEQAVSLELQRSSSIENHRIIGEPPNTCPNDNFIEIDGNCYYFSSDHILLLPPPLPLLKYEDAKTACVNLGTTEKPVRLAELGNPDNFKSDGWLWSKIRSKHVEVWLGAYDVTEQDGWKWLSGRNLSIDDPHWGPDQPNNYKGDQHCLSTIKEGDKHPKRQYFNDGNCTTPFYYVCQLFK